MPFAWNQVGNAFNAPASGGGLGDYKYRLIAAAMGLLQGDDWKEQVGGGLGGFLQGNKLDKDNRTEIDRKRVLDEAMASPELGIPGPLRGVLSAYPEAGVGVLADRMKPPDMPSSFDEFQAAQGNPDYGKFLGERSRAGAPRSMGAPEPGTRITYDENDFPVSSDLIPGSMAERKARAEAEAAENANQQREQSAGNVVNTIDRATRAIQSDPSWTSGVGGAVLQHFPNTKANDVRALITTIKANAGFDRLQAMRDASPTGGALGQVAVQEIQALQASIGNLEQSQTTDQLLRNLQIVRKTYDEIVNGPQQGGAPQGGAPDVQDMYQEFGLE